MSRITILTGFLSLLLAGCTGEKSLSEQANDFGGRGTNNANMQLEPVLDLLDLSPPPPNPDRNAYFGDLHVHTEYSFDAYNFGTTATPYDAYRYAQGEAIMHPSGYEVQLRTPLDFYAVTDHAMFLGLVKEAADTSTEFSKYDVAQPIHNINDPDNLGTASVIQRVRNFGGFIPDTVEGIQNGSIDGELVTDVTRRAWLDTIDTAEKYNAPGEFTTLVGYEYTTGSDDRGNLHRNVIFRGSEELPAVPFSRLNSQNPEGLWDWMDALRAQGIESLAIPHNSNGSNGQMFKLVDWAGNPMDDAYVKRRIRNEPLVEITQIKGTSDTHPALSPNDEWADFEIYSLRVGTTLPSEPDGSYVRQALQNGLALEGSGIQNPYQFGFVAASDTHVAATTDDESTFFSKAGILDGEPVGRGSVPVPFLYDAFRRKETFATSGPRIKVRFFASTHFDPDIIKAGNLAASAYKQGTAMGGELDNSGTPPSFIVWASADPLGTPLQRMQVINGYMKNGEPQERIYDVACSDGLQPDPTTHRCPNNGAKVNLSDCSVTPDVGDSEMLTLWNDPDYDVESDAFYYVRVLENPTCRWSTWDALREGEEPRADLHKTLQERAWSSPIWVRKSAAAQLESAEEMTPQVSGGEIL